MDIWRAKAAVGCLIENSKRRWVFVWGVDDGDFLIIEKKTQAVVGEQDRNLEH